MDKQINYLVVSERDSESQYVFKYTIQTLKERITRVDFIKRTLTIDNCIVIRFCGFLKYETRQFDTLRGVKELDGRWFERKLDDYRNKEEQKWITK